MQGRNGETNVVVNSISINTDTNCFFCFFAGRYQESHNAGEGGGTSPGPEELGKQFRNKRLHLFSLLKGD